MPRGWLLLLRYSAFPRSCHESLTCSLTYTQKKSQERLDMAHFVLSHFYLPQPHVELRTAQFGETTSAFCMHMGPWLWPSRFLQDSRQEPVLASPSHLHGRTVPWRHLTGRSGDGQICLCYASLQAGPGCQCLSAALSKAQPSATAWPIHSQPCTGNADTCWGHACSCWGMWDLA